ncbi:M24 family metallopeptidase [Dactylosporangium sp. NPDC050688]|uniref:M24 family metallopeptidase n=1 Tax=Dactylosporangium sp. NPDC050688 TaxID=3157217 RepID=UPI0034111995
MLCNLDRLRAAMRREGVAGIVATTFEHVLYLSDFGNPLPYQTGTAAAALIPADEHAPATLIVGMPYIAHLAEEPTWMPNVEVFGSIGIEKNPDVVLVAPEADVLAGMEKLRVHKSLAAGVAAALADAGLGAATVAFEAPAFAATLPGWSGSAVPGLGILTEARLIKTPDEIARLRTACTLNETAFDAAAALLTAGASWKDVTLAWRGAWALGGGTPGFWGSGAGGHASQFYPILTDYPVRAGDLVRWEGGGWYEGYWADSGRSAVVSAEPSERALAYVAALNAGAETARTLIRPGATGDEICGAVLAAIRAGGTPNFPASNVWGHGIGLNLNENPRIRPGVPGTLQPGMVVCFETPYFELGWGGLQVEDTYLITEDGNERLTFADRGLLVTGSMPV